jgi:hypothetical protein
MRGCNQKELEGIEYPNGVVIGKKLSTWPNRD